VEDMLRDFVTLIEGTRDAAGPVVVRMERMVAEVAELYYRETEYLRLLWKFRVDRSYIFGEDYTSRVASYYVRMRGALEKMLDEGMRNGELRKMDAKRMAFILLGIAEGLELEWLENEEELSMRDALVEIMGIVIAGVRK